MKQKFVLVALLGTLLSFGLHAQKDAGIKKLLSATGDISLPIGKATITKKLATQPSVTHDEEFGDTYEWALATGLRIVATPDDIDGEINLITLTAKAGSALSGVPHGLILNKTTVKEVKTKFKGNILTQYELYSAEAGDKTDGYIINVKKGKRYIRMVFNAANKLESIQLADFNIESAG